MPAIRSMPSALADLSSSTAPQSEVDHLIERGSSDRPRPTAPHSCTVSDREEERLLFWAGRKAAFPAVGADLAGLSLHGRHHSARKLPARAARHAGDVAASTACAVANVFHAGDGNLHPLILLRRQQARANCERAEEFGADILKLCVEVGGVLTGEHGVGVEKRDLMRDHVQRGRPRAAAAREMRLRPQPAAQSRQGVPDAAPLRRARPHARPPGQAALPRHPEVLRRDGASSPRDASETVADGHPGSDRQRDAAGNRRRRDASAASAGRCDVPTRCSISPGLRGVIALRAGGAGALRPARHAGAARSTRCSRSTARCWPSSRRIWAGFSAAAQGGRRSAA